MDIIWDYLKNKKMPNNKEAGILAENYVMSLLNQKGIPYVYVDDWYDLDVINEKVEIKSCQLSIKDKKNKLRMGRFDFTNKDTRDRQYEENIWVCFVVRQGTEFILIGFVRARELEKERYINLHKVREYNPHSLNLWLNLINTKKKVEGESKKTITEQREGLKKLCNKCGTKKYMDINIKDDGEDYGFIVVHRNDCSYLKHLLKISKEV